MMRIYVVVFLAVFASSGLAQVSRDTVGDARLREARAIYQREMLEARARSQGVDGERGLSQDRRQETDADRLRRAAEAERLARLQFESGIITRREYDRARVEHALLDSAVVARATGLWRARAIPRREFENTVGLLRADSIIKAYERELTLERQYTDQRERRWQMDTAAAQLKAAAEAMAHARDSLQGRAAQGSATELERLAGVVRDRQRALAAEGGRLPEVSLGMGLRCSDCTVERTSGGTVAWTFRTNPLVGAVEAGSMAERLGLRSGDTLRTINDIALTSRAGGEALGAIAPGKTVKLGWSRGGVSHTASVAIPPARVIDRRSESRLSQTVGNAHVEVFGRNVFWTRDPRTGALRISGDSIVVVVQPPGGAVRDTVRRR